MGNVGYALVAIENDTQQTERIRMGDVGYALMGIENDTCE